MTLFDYTEPISTYIYAFAAGPYEKIPYDGEDAKVPMNLYCVASNILNMNAYSNFIFDITKKSMTFYENFFGQDYPFAKYDQIWVK